MTAPLLPDSTVSSIRKMVTDGFQTEIVIERRSVARAGATVTSNDLGDDVVTFSETTESKRIVVKGWFFSTPTPVQVEEAGSIVTVNTYRLFVPVGTDITDGDRVTVGNAQYAVSDTTAESTWLAMLTCSLRKRD